MHLNQLKDLLARTKISYCIAVNLSTETIDILGSLKELKYQDLPKQLFGDIEQIKQLNDSLKGQLLPHSWKQGNVKCLVCKPKEDIIIGLFYNEDRPLFESIDFGKKTAIEINEIWQ